MPTATGARFYASASVVVVCPGCGCSRTVSARHARRAHLGVCRDCQRAPLVPAVDDEARAFWLIRFTDREFADMASAIFGIPGDPAAVAARRERLFAREAASPDYRQPARAPSPASRGFAQMILQRKVVGPVGQTAIRPRTLTPKRTISHVNRE